MARAASMGEAARREAGAGSAETRGAMTTFVRGAIGVLALVVGLRIYQGRFAFSYGLDSTSPGYNQFWFSLFAIEVVAVIAAAVLWWPRLARGCKACEAERAATGRVSARHEIGHIMTLWALLAALCGILYLEGSFFAEQDAAWHQVVIRDTALTPSHIPLFYAAFPLGVVLSVGSYLYARATLPELFKKRGFPVSFLLLISGAVLEVGQVAINEWGHSQWIQEEIFSVPFHWGFVLFAYALAGIFAVWFQTATRVLELQAGSAQAEAAAVRHGGD